MLHAVIMAGGSGTRFWPQSRKALPKQLLPLSEQRTMIQVTAQRCGTWVTDERTWVVTNAVQAQETARQLPALPTDNLLIEPCGRNTAPCIGLAAIQLQARDPDATMLVMPADHVIRATDAFQQAIQRAVTAVEQEPHRLLLFGVRPDYPATGFGYIERGLASDQDDQIFDVASFREKPDTVVAQQYVDEGSYYWNCGIFVWKAARILELIAEYEPAIYERLQSLQEAIGTPQWTAALDAEFPQMNSISIDYAVLERAQDVCVMEAPFDWDDVGSWHALARLLGDDAQGNTLDGNVCQVDSNGCIVRSPGDHLIAIAGVQDLIIVHTPDVTLVARKDDENAVRNLVAELEARGHSQYL